VQDINDAFPLDANESLDTDSDGTGNNTDTDDDNDAWSDTAELACATDPMDNTSVPVDTDADGICNALDEDDDNDGVLDISDAFPLDNSESIDTDDDGFGNNLDTDDDNDGVLDINDAFPLDASEWLDTDGDGIGNNADPDDDNDGILDEDDDDPLNPPTGDLIVLASQDWQSFFTGSSNYLSDFGLHLNSQQDEYVVNSQIQFNTSWTKRSRHQLADLLGYSRGEMTQEFANSLCSPQLEMVQASLYGAGDTSNMIAELDTDLSQCGLSSDEPATVTINSFIPTQVGYHYRLTVKYRMRLFDNTPNNAYRQLVMQFGRSKTHFDAVFDEFNTVTMEILASDQFSKLTIEDNNLPDGYGILIDDVEILQLDKNEQYDSCLNLFSEDSAGFSQCILGEVDSDQTCTMDNFVFDYQSIGDIDSERMVVSNALIQQVAIDGTVNFLSLGKKGKLSTSCYLDNYLAAFPIYNQQLILREIAWSGEDIATYPEQASISVSLSHCDDSRVNGKNQLGLVSTDEFFSYDFTTNNNGISYSGCRLKGLDIMDKTPKKSPSTDGFDLNSLEFRSL